MIRKMLADKGGDKVIAVVVSFLHAKGQGKIRFTTGGFQILGIELIGEKLITCAMIDE